jgi:hypothetical protein
MLKDMTTDRVILKADGREEFQMRYKFISGLREISRTFRSHDRCSTIDQEEMMLIADR